MPNDAASFIINRRIRELIDESGIAISKDGLDQANRMICEEAEMTGIQIREWLTGFGFKGKVSRQEVETILSENRLLRGMFNGEDPLREPICSGGQPQDEIIEERLQQLQSNFAVFEHVTEETPDTLLSKYEALKRLRGELDELQKRLRDYSKIYLGLLTLNGQSAILKQKNDILLERLGEVEQAFRQVDEWFKPLSQLKEINDFIQTALEIDFDALIKIENRISSAKELSTQFYQKIETFSWVGGELGRLYTQTERLAKKIEDFSQKAETYFDNLQKQNWPVGDFPRRFQEVLEEKREQVEKFRREIQALEQQKNTFEDKLCRTSKKGRVKGRKYQALTLKVRTIQRQKLAQCPSPIQIQEAVDVERIVPPQISVDEFSRRIDVLTQCSTDELYHCFEKVLESLAIEDCPLGSCPAFNSALDQLVSVENHLIEQTALALTSRMRELFLAIDIDPALLDKEKFAQVTKPCTDYFNRLTQFVVSEIVNPSFITARVRVFERWIWVANLCKEQGDLHSAMSIYLAFVKNPIDRLEQTRRYISDEAAFVFKNLEQLLSAQHNQEKLRAYLKEHPNTIPYIGLYSKDLTFIQDGHEKRVLTQSERARVDVYEPLMKRQQAQRKTMIELSPIAQMIQRYFDQFSIPCDEESSKKSFICEPKDVQPDDERFMPNLVLALYTERSVASPFMQDQVLKQPSALDAIVSIELVRLIKLKLGRRWLDFKAISQEKIKPINEALITLNPKSVLVVHSIFGVDMTVEEITNAVFPAYSTDTHTQYERIFDWMVHHRILSTIQVGRPNLTCLFTFHNVEAGYHYLHSDWGRPLSRLAEKISDVTVNISKDMTRDGLLIRLLVQSFKFDTALIMAGKRRISAQEGGDELLVNYSKGLKGECEPFCQRQRSGSRDMTDVGLLSIFVMEPEWVPSSTGERRTNGDISKLIIDLIESTDQGLRLHKERAQIFDDLFGRLLNQGIVRLLLQMMDIIRCKEDIDEKERKIGEYRELSLNVLERLSKQLNTIGEFFLLSEMAEVRGFIKGMLDGIDQLERLLQLKSQSPRKPVYWFGFGRFFSSSARSPQKRLVDNQKGRAQANASLPVKGDPPVEQESNDQARQKISDELESKFRDQLEQCQTAQDVESEYSGVVEALHIRLVREVYGGKREIFSEKAQARGKDMGFTSEQNIIVAGPPDEDMLIRLREIRDEFLQSLSERPRSTLSHQ